MYGYVWLFMFYRYMLVFLFAKLRASLLILKLILNMLFVLVWKGQVIAIQIAKYFLTMVAVSTFLLYQGTCSVNEFFII